jgi:IS5 family transposase
LAEVLFAEVNRQLDARGLMLKAGTLIDATLVEAAVARPPASGGEVSTKDPERASRGAAGSRWGWTRTTTRASMGKAGARAA